MSTTFTATDANFDEDVLKSATPVLVEFMAPWCGPCKALAPVLDKLAVDLAGQVAIGKMDIDANPSTSGKMGIRGVPTMMVFRGGSVIATKVGAISEGQLKVWLKSVI